MKTNPGVNWLQNCGEKRYSGEKLRRQQGSLGLLCTVHSAVLSLLTLLSSFKLIQVHLSLIKLKLCCELQLHMSFSALVSQTHTHTLLKVLHWIGAFLIFCDFWFLWFFQLRAIGAAQLGSEMRRLRRHPAGKLTHNLHPPFLHWFTILILILIVVVVVVVKLPRNMILIICTGMLAHEKQALPRRRKFTKPANFYPFPAEKCSAQHIPDLNSYFKPPFPCAFIHIAGIHWNWCLHCTKDSCSCDAHCAVQLLQLFQVCNRFYLWFSFFFLKTAEGDPTDFG